MTKLVGTSRNFANRPKNLEENCKEFLDVDDFAIMCVMV